MGGAAVTVDELTKTTQDDLQRIELFALPLLLLLSLLVFRGLVAALLPVIVGALSILTSLLLLNALTPLVDIDTFAINIVTGLGLGLAIDYSLFLVTRFREELKTKNTIEATLVATTAAMGRMIVFSGLTVAVSLVSLCIFPQRFLYSIGIGGALVALMSAAVCLLFLPALLALLGTKVNALAPPALQGDPSRRRWFALARFVLGHPVSVAVVATRRHGDRRTADPARRADPGERPDPAPVRERPAGRRRASRSNLRRTRPIASSSSRPNRATARAAARQLRRRSGGCDRGTPVRVGPGVFRVDALLAVDPYSNRALDAVRNARSERLGEQGADRGSAG